MNTLTLDNNEKELLLIGSALSDFDAVISLDQECIHADFQHWQDKDKVLTDQQYDLAVVLHALECMNKNEGLYLMAQLRDVLAKRIIIFLSENESFNLHDMLAMAFIHHGYLQMNNVNYSIYRYSLKDYKQTPDWLNNRFWANPELFGKFRW